MRLVKSSEIDASRQPGTAADIHSEPALLWKWPQVEQATSIPRRTLQKLIAAGDFPRPIRRVGKRPYWLRTDVVAWIHCSPSTKGRG
jgi:predicted DNA-binding transcriptional regulator AlpA